MIKLEASLNHKDLKKLTSNLRTYKRLLIEKKEAIVTALSNHLVKEIKAQLSATVNKTYGTGELADSIVSSAYSMGSFESECIVKATAFYAKYVEVGTGQVGQNTVQASSNGIANPFYDGDYRQSKWMYYNDQLEKDIWTNGEKAHMYMFEGLIWLNNNYERICREKLAQIESRMG